MCDFHLQVSNPIYNLEHPAKNDQPQDQLLRQGELQCGLHRKPQEAREGGRGY